MQNSGYTSIGQSACINASKSIAIPYCCKPYSDLFKRQVFVRHNRMKDIFFQVLCRQSPLMEKNSFLLPLLQIHSFIPGLIVHTKHNAQSLCILHFLRIKHIFTFIKYSFLIQWFGARLLQQMSHIPLCPDVVPSQYDQSAKFHK